MAAMPTGMLTQKMPRQPTESTRAPPVTGPRAMLNPNTAPQTPMAWARSRRSVNVLVMIDIATGFSIEPPTACSIRKPISQPVLGARLQASEPRVKMASPAWKVRRRPMRSAVEPENSSRLARTRV